MHDVSRRGAFKIWSGWCASLLIPCTAANAAIASPSNPFDNLGNEAGAIRARLLLREAAYEALREKLTKEIFEDYFATLDVEHFDGKRLTTSVASRFPRNWITEFYLDELLTAAKSIDPSVKQVVVARRRHQSQRPRELEYWRPRGATSIC